MQNNSSSLETVSENLVFSKPVEDIKFNPDQKVDLIEYLIKVIEIKINQL